MKAVAWNEKIYDEAIGIYKADMQPRLDLDGAYGWSTRDPDNFFESNYKKWALGVTLKVPVFDGWRTAGKVAQARADRAKVEQDRAALETQIDLEAKQAVDRLRVAASVFRAAELSVAQARRAAEMTNANYQLGAATTLDVLDAQAALTQAEWNRVEALHAHANARAGLRYVLGRDPLDTGRAAAARTRDHPRTVMTTRSLLLLAALPLSLPACSGRAPRRRRRPVPRGVPVRTAAVETRDLDETLVLAGTLRPRAQVELVAELQARLMRVVRDEGARVAAGELLAVLDATDYRLANERAKAALAVAEANRSHALAEKERAESLLKTGGITAKDNAVGAGRAAGGGGVASRRSRPRAAIAAQQLSRTEIRAPFAGRVAKRHADPGAMLASGTQRLHLRGRRRARVPRAGAVRAVRQGEARGRASTVQVDALSGRTVRAGSRASRRSSTSARARSR